MLYRLVGLPPVCLRHGVDDELSPFSQSVQLAKELERCGMPYRICAYEGLFHHFSTSTDRSAIGIWRPVERQIFRDSLDCLYMV